MQQRMHVLVTADVMQRCGLRPDGVDCVAEPDRVGEGGPDDSLLLAGDVRAEGFGSRILGMNLCSLLHFCVPVPRRNGCSFRGYSWDMDRSLFFLSALEMTPLEVPSVSAPGVGSGPYRSLFDSTTSRRLTDLTFPTAAAMAGFFWSLAWGGIGSYRHAIPPPRAVLWACHMVQDVLGVKHHQRGFLLRGHGEGEAQAFESYLVERGEEVFWSAVAAKKKLLERRLGLGPDADVSPAEIRRLIEVGSRMPASTALAAAGTDLVLRWAWNKGGAAWVRA